MKNEKIVSIPLCPECGYDDFETKEKVKCGACGASFASMQEIENRQADVPAPISCEIWSGKNKGVV